ncbi:MAG: AmmeMemoRadiSam system protein A [Oscillospiraceae bacterium]|nr:AmmeMemoRadiSam system protein A [Oscillospiraceae bacterium]
MSMVKAYTLPHPPLAIPEVGKGKESKEIKDTLVALDAVAEEIAAIAPETIIYVTPHGTVYFDYFHISPGSSATGDMGRFGAPQVRFEARYDEELIEEITHIAEQNDIHAGTKGERDSNLDHGVTVPMWFIDQKYTNYAAIRLSQSGMAPSEHYMMGQVIAKAAEMTGRKTVLIASSDLSHKLQDNGPYGFAPEGPQFDKLITDAIEKGDFLSILKIPEKIRERAGECGYNSLMVLAGCFDRQNIETKLLSYEAPFGVGYAVASFTPIGENAQRNLLEQYVEFAVNESDKRKNAEDEYQNLARRSLEHIIETGEKLSAPSGLPNEMLKRRAGVFVSLHKSGRLRGCIGTISPTTDNIAQEIIQNAISAGLSDTRFDPVTESELPYIDYKVDVLSAPEPITNASKLDVNRYGVIVTSGYKRGLLLPNLDGIDTVEEQIRIAMQKAGIGDNEEVKLERFEVIRHES